MLPAQLHGGTVRAAVRVTPLGGCEDPKFQLAGCFSQLHGDPTLIVSETRNSHERVENLRGALKRALSGSVKQCHQQDYLSRAPLIGPECTGKVWLLTLPPW